MRRHCHSRNDGTDSGAKSTQSAPTRHVGRNKSNCTEDGSTQTCLNNNSGARNAWVERHSTKRHIHPDRGEEPNAEPASTRDKDNCKTATVAAQRQERHKHARGRNTTNKRVRTSTEPQSNPKKAQRGATEESGTQPQKTTSTGRQRDAAISSYLTSQSQIRDPLFPCLSALLRIFSVQFLHLHIGQCQHSCAQCGVSSFAACERRGRTLGRCLTGPPRFWQL